MADHREPVDPVIFRLMAEQAKDYALFALDTEGRVMTWNLGAQRIKGYAPEEIIGRHFSVFYAREALDRGWPAHELKVAASEGRFEDEGWRLRKDGSRFWASVTITALRGEDGGLLGFSKITRDLTERRMHEEALRLSEARFRLLVESVVDYAIFMLDPQGIVSSWNAGAERIKGYRHAEIVGSHFSRFYTADDLAANKPALELATAERVGRSEDEGWRVKKDGERFWARVVITPLHDAERRLIGFAKVTQDLSERRHIQDLEKAARNVNEFIGVLAHELRNPLAPIRNAVHVMARIPAGDPAHETMRRTIDRQTAQLGRIVDDMVDVSRITRGALSIKRTAVDLADVVRDAVETVSPSVVAAGHHLGVELPAERLVVQGDADRLTQVLVNLLTNAVRYTPAGGSITLSARPDGGSAVLTVRDNGRGIEPEMMERMFHMFIQGRAPLERVGGGLGIGLALARKLSELHGGTLEGRSEGKDQGSEFIVRIPRTGIPDRNAPVGPDGSPASAPIPRRVLIVDDNVDATVTLDLLLRSLGHETCVVNDGAAALGMAAAFKPDVVLLDLGMPGLDGYEVARRLRTLPEGAALRIVAITGWGQEADRARSKAAGVDLHLMKPANPGDLARALTVGRSASP